MNKDPVQSDYHVIMIPSEKKQDFYYYDIGGCAVVLFQVALILGLLCVIIWALVVLL